MRESRTSGSVEGAMGNHSSYSDCLYPSSFVKLPNRRCEMQPSPSLELQVQTSTYNRNS